ncbi:MAG: DUF4270 domain-containing protein [Flavobacterium sp.]|nr:DUF4270 domain-containing protein [Flavobacterium sp.]
MKKIVLNIALLISVITFTACDKDFNTIGSDVIGDDHFDFDKKDDVSLIAHTRATGPVQSNNLPLKALGVYKDDYFGTTKASFVTQISLANNAPDFGLELEQKQFDVVNLYIPYSSTQTATGTGNEPNTFTLNEIYGKEDHTFNLKVTTNNYLLREFDALNPEVRQKYYSDQKSLILNAPGTRITLNDSPLENQNTKFKFSKEEILIYKKNDNNEFVDSENNATTDPTKYVIDKRYAPGIWLQLNKDFFKDNVLFTSSSNLINNSVFREHIKGIFFDLDSNIQDDSSPTNVLALLDFSNAFIEIEYHSKSSTDASATKTKKTLRLNFTGNSITFFENNNSSEYTTALNSSSSLSGDALLYPKGGDGSIVFIDLFGPDDSGDVDNIPEELEQLRTENILVNDAFLTFYVKKGLIENTSVSVDPINYSTRVYLYDATNNTPLLDYVFDTSTASDSKNNKLVFGGILEINEVNDQLTRYRVRLRNHINNIINGTNSSTNGNVRLGLSVTQNINNSGRYEVKNTTSFGTQYIPIGSIIQPRGAVIYGNNTTEVDKRLKLEIYYTKPN